MSVRLLIISQRSLRGLSYQVRNLIDLPKCYRINSKKVSGSLWASTSGNLCLNTNSITEVSVKASLVILSLVGKKHILCKIQYVHFQKSLFWQYCFRKFISCLQFCASDVFLLFSFLTALFKISNRRIRLMSLETLCIQFLVESQDHSGWKGPQEVCSLSSCSQQGQV